VRGIIKPRVARRKKSRASTSLFFSSSLPPLLFLFLVRRASTEEVAARKLYNRSPNTSDLAFLKTASDQRCSDDHRSVLDLPYASARYESRYGKNYPFACRRWRFIMFSRRQVFRFRLSRNQFLPGCGITRLSQCMSTVNEHGTFKQSPPGRSLLTCMVESNR